MFTLFVNNHFLQLKKFTIKQPKIQGLFKILKFSQIMLVNKLFRENSHLGQFSE